MKKKLLALFAACSMIATASAGLVQTAYAAGPNVRIEVADGASDTQKILTLYYEGFDAMNAVQGKLSFTGGDVTINSASITIPCDNSAAETNGTIYFVSFEDGGTSSADGSFATATITVPADADITVNFDLEVFENSDFEDYTDQIQTPTVVIPKSGGQTTTPAEVVAVEKQKTVTGTEDYASQTADIYGVKIAANDDTVTGATINVGGKTGVVNFGTAVTGTNVVFAVILVSESGAEIPVLVADNVTPIVAID